MALKADLVVLNTAVAGKWLDAVLKEKVPHVLPKTLWWIHEMRGHYFSLEYVKHLPFVAGAMIDSHVTAEYWKNRTEERLRYASSCIISLFFWTLIKCSFLDTKSFEISVLLVKTHTLHGQELVPAQAVFGSFMVSMVDEWLKLIPRVLKLHASYFIYYKFLYSTCTLVDSSAFPISLATENIFS